MANYRNSVAEIDLRALKANYSFLQDTFQKSGSGCLIPMVKADAYGHGDIRVAQALESLQPPYFGVALIEEGIRLRNEGIRTPILVFGQVDAVACEAIIKYDLIPVLSQFHQVAILKNHLPETSNFPIHIKFNTGMQRLGFELDQCEELIRSLQGSRHLHVRGVCTHLISSDDFGSPQGRTQEQLEKFSKVVETFRTQVDPNIKAHALNSGGILTNAKPRFDYARPGISLYGLRPSKTVSDKGLQPVMSVKTQIGFLHHIKSGTTVSYSGTWKAKRESLIAVIPLGYADGVPRVLSNKGFVLVQGRKVPMVGTVCMDYFMVDLTEIKDLKPQIGDEVVFFGRQGDAQITAEEVGDLAGTISYEILTGIQDRMPRAYLD